MQQQIMMKYNVKSHGAAGDGNSIDTSAINAAIEAASNAGGAMVYFPPGTYLSSSIRLKSNVTLYLEAGSTIEAVDDKTAPYDLPEPNPAGGNYQDYGHSHWQNSLIWGIGLNNVSILGPGLIHGKGLNAGFNRFADEARGERRYQDGGPGSGNKAIALKECSNVILRDFSILHGGHFAILATAVDNITIDNLKIDTNRDGMDIDCCNNVRITRCSVNSPWDDGICLKASYALGEIRHCENITISDCYLAGNYIEGTLLDATFKRCPPEYNSYRTGRIKLGTESNGDFRNIVISNCVFDDCRGIAIESVDGSHIEDIAISNITMREVANSPIFIRLGNRGRGPDNPPVGSIKRISINNIVASNVAENHASTISGIPGHLIEDIRISNVRLNHEGGGQTGDRFIQPSENAEDYPEPGMFGPLPAYGFYIRHATGMELNGIKLDYNNPESRSAITLDDVSDICFYQLNFQRGIQDAPLLDCRNVTQLTILCSLGFSDRRIIEKTVQANF